MPWRETTKSNFQTDPWEYISSTAGRVQGLQHVADSAWLAYLPSISARRGKYFSFVTHTTGHNITHRCGMLPFPKNARLQQKAEAEDMMRGPLKGAEASMPRHASQHSDHEE